MLSEKVSNVPVFDKIYTNEMPILNPQQAFNINKDNKNFDCLLYSIEQILSKVSATFSISNRKMMQIHEQFVDFIMNNIAFVKTFFNLDDEKLYEIWDYENDNMFNKIYRLILNSPPPNDPFQVFELRNICKSSRCQNAHFINPYMQKNLKFFISDYSYAVITSNLCELDDYEIFKLKLFSYIIVAAGYTLVASFFIHDRELLYEQYMEPLLFSETHIFVEIEYNPELPQDNILKLPNLNYSSPDFGYIYLYIHYNNLSFDIDLKKSDFTYLSSFKFSKKFKDIFKSEMIFTESETIYIHGISHFLISNKKSFPINLCNVPLYTFENNWTPKTISNIKYGIILERNFNHFTFDRVPIVIEGIKQPQIDYQDIHKMNAELYISDQMYLANQNFDISIIESIKNDIKASITPNEIKQRKSKNILKNIKEKIRTSFHNLYKFTNAKGKKFEPHTNQIYAVYQALSGLSNDQKGTVLQVSTGEGKSYIIQALAQCLAEMGYTVHIATSNIILAARDFKKSYRYFRKSDKNLKPSILLHKNEMNEINEFLEKLKEKHQKTYKKMFNSFYSDDNFENPLSMNLSVCLNNKEKSNIIFSTLINFEAFYLNQSEQNPLGIDKYLNNCYLIVDEADSILIDELTNGTIISKPMNSNAVEVLKYVYDLYVNDKENSEAVSKMVKAKFPECTDLTQNDVDRMFSDIEKVNSIKFSEGSEYKIDDQKIFPFNKKKGIIEKSKEFSGYIQQFIGIKEKIDNIQPLSISYNFISHPIYILKYKGLCGFTGTIGSENDIKLIKDNYKIYTKSIPRHKMNLRRDLPIIACDNIDERNERICEEALFYHKLGHPVLIVFINTNEIKAIEKLLITKCYGIEKDIITFDGANEDKKKNIESTSGRPKSITLSTNFCGRGVSIQIDDNNPFLCVIVSYYSQDNRTINQVLGRSGRHGKPGITRVICTKEMLYGNYQTPKDEAITSILKEFEIKNKKYLNFIKKISDTYPWIFDGSEHSERIPYDIAYKYNSYILNVNRITATKFKFPICMSVETFLKIQAQRIFSLKNCPECKCTWRLFAIYMRELFLESFSLFLNSVDNNYKLMKKNNNSIEYKTFIDDQYLKYEELLNTYISDDKSIFSAFTHILEMVNNEWKNKIIQHASKLYEKKEIIKESSNGYSTFKFGFFPMELAQNSGAKISFLTPDEQKKSKKGQLYIIDPELKYEKNKKPYSITDFIDKVFEKFQSVVDQKLKNLFGIRFFLRRNLAGCEFGACIDTDSFIECENNLINCLIDAKPLLMFTVCTKSEVFWIAGILMFVLYIFVIICSEIASILLNPRQIGDKVIGIFTKLVNVFFGIDDDDADDDDAELITNFSILLNIVDDKVQSLLEHYNSQYKSNKGDDGSLFDLLFSLDLNDEEISEKFQNAFSNIKITNKIGNACVKSLKPLGKLIKIGIKLIILLYFKISDFIAKGKITYKYSTKAAKEYQNDEEKNSGKNDIENYKSYKYAEDLISGKNSINDT